MSDLISRADAIEALCHNCAYYTDAQCKTDSGYWCESGAMIREDIPSAELPKGELIESADAVQIHNDGTLEVTVPNAHKVGRVLVMDVDSHIGGGLFYPDDAEAEQGEWKPFDTTWGRSIYYCSVCEESTYVPTEMGNPIYNYCPLCGSYMRKKGGAE